MHEQNDDLSLAGATFQVKGFVDYKRGLLLTLYKGNSDCNIQLTNFSKIALDNIESIHI